MLLGGGRGKGDIGDLGHNDRTPPNEITLNT